MASNAVNIVVTAKDEASSKLDGIGKKAGLAFAAVGVGAAAAAAKSLVEFGKFQTGMNEVFTLLPGISQDAMGKMEGDVKSFSREFGVLPEKTIPALYQALSAGVPQDNVFTFLETAQKAAKGGVTDLETAVDGISSVMNAYGSDVVDATKASDLMFTAVKLGKTDFNQLSNSLFNVVPTAAAMGVQFEDVTAALARMTAQGTPTSVATTQLRAAFVEASKSGTNLDKALKQLHGEGFAQLIDSGMNTGEIFESLRASMPEQEFKDLFGSVEAMNAALAITGPQAAGFQDALDQMKDSSGATDAAFQQMSNGLADSMEKIKANIAVLWIEIGSRLAPVVESLLDFFITKGIPALEEFAGKAAEVGGQVRDGLAGPISDAKTIIQEQVIPAFQALGTFIQETILPPLREFGDWFKNNESAMQAAAIAIGTVLVAAFGALAVSAGAAAVAVLASIAPFVAVAAAVGAVGAGIFLLIKHWDSITEKFPILGTVADAVKGALEAFAGWITGTFVPSVMGIATAVGDAVMAAIGFVTDHWATITAIIGPPIEAAVTIVKAQFDAMKVYIDGAIGVIKGYIDVFIGVFTGDWSQAWDGAKQVVSSAWDTITGLVEIGIGLIADLAPLMLDAAVAIFTAMLNGAQSLWTGTIWPWIQTLPGLMKDGLIAGVGLLLTAGTALLTGLVDGASSFWSGTAQPWMASIPSKIKAAIGAVGRLLWDIGKAIMESLWDGLKAKWEEVKGWLGSVTDMIPDWKGPIEKDRKLLTPTGIAIMEGLLSGMQDGWQDVEDALQGFTLAIEDALQKDYLTETYGDIGASVIGAFTTAVEEDTPAAGAALARAVERMFEEAEAVGKPISEEQGKRLMEFLAWGIKNGSAEVIAQVIEVIGQISATIVEEVEEVAQLTGETFGAALDAAFADQALLDKIGNDGVRLMDALNTALEEGGQRNIDTLAKMVADVSKELKDGLPPAQAGFLGAEFMAAFNRVIDEGSDEAKAAFEDMLGQINTILDGGAIDIRTGTIVLGEDIDALAKSIGVSAEEIIANIGQFIDNGLFSLIGALDDVSDRGKDAIDQLVQDWQDGLITLAEVAARAADIANGGTGSSGIAGAIADAEAGGATSGQGSGAVIRQAVDDVLSGATSVEALIDQGFTDLARYVENELISLTRDANRAGNMDQLAEMQNLLSDATRMSRTQQRFINSQLDELSAAGFRVNEDFSISRMARGGITNGPMLALIGDNPGGREAVIPLPPGGGGIGGNVTVVVEGPGMAQLASMIRVHNRQVFN